MDEGELLLELQNIKEKLKQRQQMIDQWIAHGDPELQTFGQNLKPVVDEFHTLITHVTECAQTWVNAPPLPNAGAA